MLDEIRMVVTAAGVAALLAPLILLAIGAYQQTRRQR